jgi:hypothetical protein
VTKYEIRETNKTLARRIESRPINASPDSLIMAHMGMMLTEIAAQLAELNEHLSSVIGEASVSARKRVEVRK